MCPLKICPRASRKIVLWTTDRDQYAKMLPFFFWQLGCSEWNFTSGIVSSCKQKTKSSPVILVQLWAFLKKLALLYLIANAEMKLNFSCICTVYLSTHQRDMFLSFWSMLDVKEVGYIYRIRLVMNGANTVGCVNIQHMWSNLNHLPLWGGVSASPYHLIRSSIV